MSNYSWHSTILVLLFAIITFSYSCSVCQRCTNCGPDILADKYLDGIDALIQTKVQNLGYPVQIQRIVSSNQITYSINYSNGLSVLLGLTLSNMQIQLKSYSLNTQSQTISTFASSDSASSSGISSQSTQSKNSSNQSQINSSGYQQIANYQSNQIINSILKSLSTSSFIFSSSMLANAQQAQINGLNYYKFALFFSRIVNIQLSKPLYYQIIVTQTDNKSFKVVNSSYLQLSSPNLINLTFSDIQIDLNIQQIAVFILQQKYSMLPPNSQVVLVARDFPHYRLVFDNQQNVYITVNVLYDFYSREVQIISVTSTNFPTSQKTTTSQNQSSQNQIKQGIQSSTQSKVNSSTNKQILNSQNTNQQKAILNTTTTIQTSQTTSSVSSQTGSSSQSTTQTQTSGQRPRIVSGTPTDDQSVINLQDVTYIRASSSLTNQNYVSLYLRYLASNNFRYQASNLIGIYINSCLPNTLLFRYLYNGQQFNQIITTSDIQQILVQNLGNTVTQSTTINQSSNRNSQSNNISTSNNIQNEVNFGGINYIITTTAFSSQLYITQYLAYLADNYKSYDLNNLVGVYINPQNTNSLLFRYRSNNQFVNLVSNVSDIQQLLKLLQSKTQPNGKKNTQTVITTSSQQNTNTNTTIINTNLTGSNLSSSTSNKNVSGSTQGASGSVNLSQNNSNLVTGKVQQPTNIQSSSQQTSGQSNGIQQSSGRLNSAQLSVMIQVDPKCLCYEKGKCIRCGHRFYLSNSKCIEVPKQCLSYDVNSGDCINCVPGYQIKSGVCQKQQTTGYYFNNQCLACFGNYKMVKQRCIYSPNIKDSNVSVIQAKNILCVSWNGQNCAQCIPGTYLTSRKMCELVDPFCAVFDYVFESCNSCENGYSLRNGRCFRQ